MKPIEDKKQRGVPDDDSFGDIEDAMRRLEESGAIIESIPATPENLRKLFDRSEWFKDEEELPPQKTGGLRSRIKDFINKLNLTR